MIRKKDKAKKIFFSILGVPSNIQSGKLDKKNKMSKRLLFEQTQRVR